MTNVNENLLKQALLMYAEKLADSLPSEQALKNIEFSQSFERKMAKLLKRQKSFFYKSFNSAAKRAAVIVVAVITLFTVTFSVGAVRNPLLKMVKTVFGNHIEVGFEGEATKEITEIYEPTVLPEGYAKTKENINAATVSYEYQNSQGHIIMFFQNSTKNFFGAIDTEHNTHEKIEHNGLELNVVKSEKWNTIMVYWLKDGYHFQIDSLFSNDFELIRPMIDSTQIVATNKGE